MQKEIQLALMQEAVNAILWAYETAEQSGSIQWENLDRAFELAKRASPKQYAKIKKMVK